MKEIQTERLILRTNCIVENGDLKFPEPPRFTSLLDIQPSKAEDGGFAIYLKSGDKVGELVGHIGILFKRKPYELTIGIEEQYRRRGYMTEAQDAAIRWIFDNCDTEKITALVGSITPVASRKLCVHSGFHEAREGREEWWILDKKDFL